MEQSFWESNLFQTLVMIITVFVTGIIYVLNKRSTLQAAATILKLQIKDIEENIEVLKAEAIVGNSLSEQPLYYSKIIFVENIAPIQEIDTANCIHFKLNSVVLNIHIDKKDNAKTNIIAFNIYFSFILL